MRAEQDRSVRTRELSPPPVFEVPEPEDCLAPEFVSQLVDVSQELADVIASANADAE